MRSKVPRGARSRERERAARVRPLSSIALSARGKVTPTPPLNTALREPRYTTFWRRRNAADGASLSAALELPPVRATWDRAVRAVLAQRTSSVPVPRLDARVAAAVDELCARLIEAAPVFARRQGVHLRATLAEVLLPGAAGLPVDAHARRIERLSPDSPLTLRDDRVIDGAFEATKAQLLEFHGYLRSVRPAKPTGRPHKAPSRSRKPRGRPRLDARIAVEAFRRKAKGAHWREIARTLGLGPAYGARANATRQKVRRYIERGGILERTGTKEPTGK